MLPPSLQDSLPAGWLAFAGRGASTLWIAAKGFRSSILLFWTWPGAREVSFRTSLSLHNSITSSARTRNDSGIVSPSALAVFIDGQLESDRLHKQASDLACIGSGPRSQRDNYENSTARRQLRRSRGS